MRSPSSLSSQQSRVVAILLLVVTAQWAARHLLALLQGPNADLAWYAVDVLRAIGMSSALALCATLTPWRSLRLKCFFAAACAYYFSDSIICGTWYAWEWPDPTLSALAQGVAFVGIGLLYWFRSYRTESALPMPDGRIYCVRRIPSSAQDFAISLMGFYGADGGYSIYANGYLYKYSGGQLLRRKVPSVSSIGYHVTRGSKIGESVMSELDSLVGSKWSWKSNCLTVLAPIWRRHSG